MPPQTRRQDRGRIERWRELHEAIEEGNIETVKQAIADSADVNANVQSWNGWTPLHFEAQRNQKVGAKLLIANGADVNGKDKDGETPLDLAVSGGKKATAALLRKHGGKTMWFKH